MDAVRYIIEAKFANGETAPIVVCWDKGLLDQIVTLVKKQETVDQNGDAFEISVKSEDTKVKSWCSAVS